MIINVFQQEMCGAANVKSGDILSNLGETVLCSPDGEQCRAVQCFSTNQGPGNLYLDLFFL